MTNQGTTPFQSQEIKLNIQPLIVDVSIFVSGGGHNESGKASLTVNETGMYLQPLSQGWAFNRLKPMGILWADVRELHPRKKQYVANVGVGRTDTGRTDIILRFSLLKTSQDRKDTLQSVFDQLPAQASARRCPTCSGPVVNDICQNCGKSFRFYQRKRGLYFLIIGGLFVIFGIGFASSGTKTPEAGILAAIFGAVMIIFGLIRVIFGTRTG
jgi:hypothetical protein